MQSLLQREGKSRCATPWKASRRNSLIKGSLPAGRVGSVHKVDSGGHARFVLELGDASLGASASLIQFQRAAEIRSVFFGGGAAGPAVRLEMKPLQMDPALLQFSLDMDGQLLRYAHGPSVPQQLRWPGTRGTNQIRIQVSPGASGGDTGLLFEGPWAIFRMFDRAQVQPSAQPE
ncbi:MAG TPA: type VI secretion IcmF C-terminal domain-containing protein, partial [Burkholderiaceae bacterium]|nr:type VI secretion IcmF C-terminal domain-containing protein [Burkholderiaceae bacterium]